MNDQFNANPMGSARYTQKDLRALTQIRELVLALTGVQLTEQNNGMIASRLARRMKELSLTTLPDYLDCFQKNRERETPHLVSLLTTHHTFFFREFAQFEYLAKEVLPSLLPILKSKGQRKINLWSAACSRGQEVYSLAMFLDVQLKKLAPTIGYEIFGTDIDAASIEIAKNAVYPRTELAESPLLLLGDHWAKGSGDIAHFVKAKKSITSQCSFGTANLLDLENALLPDCQFDIIFCRNVFIYFNQQQITKISLDLSSRLAKHGALFIGIAESLSGLNLPLINQGISVYFHKAYLEEIQANQKAQSKATEKQSLTSDSNSGSNSVKINQKLPIAPPTPPLPIRVLCVDDSPLILSLLKKILVTEKGFEIVGTAGNGLEAAKKVLELRPDVVTLDIHMPEQSGIEYLEKNLKPGHPPVVMVTSVSRENSDLAGRSLELGAMDYVEKPALSQLAERGEELRTKLSCAIQFSKEKESIKTSLDRSFQTQDVLKEPDKKIRFIVFPLSARSKLKQVLKEFKGVQPPTYLCIEGVKEAIGGLAKTLSNELGLSILAQEVNPEILKPGQTQLIELSSGLQQFLQMKGDGNGKKISILVFGEVSKASVQWLIQLQGAHLLLEDNGQGKGATHLMEIANDVVVSSSFAYMSNQFFCKP